MQKSYKKAPIPDLRKKSGYAGQVNLNYTSLGLLILIGIIIAVLIAGILSVSAYPNSNFPANL